MTDPLDRLRTIEVPDQWDEIVARADAAGVGDDELDVDGRNRRPWLAAAAVVALVAAGAVALRAGDDDREPVDVGSATTPTTATTTGSCDIANRSTIDGLDVEVQSPLTSFVPPGARTEGVATHGVLATLWLLDDGSARVLVPITECGGYEVHVSGHPVQRANADLARDIAEAVELGAPSPTTTTSPPVATNCDDLRVGATALPDLYSASLSFRGVSVGGAFEGNGERVAVRLLRGEHVVVDSTEPFGPLEGALGTLDGAPAYEASIDGCTVALVADGAGADDVRLLAGALFEAGFEGEPSFRIPAVWPETDASQLPVGGLPADREDPAAVVVAFATAVLGWDDAEAALIEPSDDGFSELTASVHRRSAPEVSITLCLSRSAGGRWWSIQEVGEVVDRIVTIEGASAFAGGGAEPAGTASATARFDFGGRVVEGPVDEPVDLGAEPDARGSVVVLFRDDAGDVIGAWGTTIAIGGPGA